MLPEIRFITGQERNSQMEIVIEDTLAEETDPLAALATVAAYIFAFMERLNWVGFYIARGETLVVGPYQGQPACVRIPFGKGVCGTVASERRAIRVDEVEAFPGYISCDSSTRSELVAPILIGGKLFGVLDLDSPEPARFSEDDLRMIQRIANLVAKAVAKSAALEPALV
ncbi:MAG: GAF domain-containing protein [Oscillospiraceae bacterium]|jgi:GAF domain-containing protein|nr:GAF domain-containing protein [Oscillospiraceae bacterium]